MIVSNAQIAMTTNHEYSEEHHISEKMDFWVTADKGSGANSQTSDTTTPGEEVNISARGFSLLELQRNSQHLNLSTRLDARSRINLMILQRLYEAITGQAMTVIDPADMPSTSSEQTLDVSTATPGNTATVAAPPTGYGLVYERHERYQEQEKLQFQATGVIQTKDGRTLEFSTSLTMNRDYVKESNLSIRAGDAKKIDPLIINFDGKGAELSQTRFNFDLDANGTEEQLASLRPGSGFLAFDRNGDGVINNGTELFGPSSGQGFAELAQFDEDGNNFIDEGDSIYNKLRIWTTNEDGSTQLVALGDKQIGAIFLGHLTSPFQLKDDNNKSLGEIASSGIYLSENGKAGVIQQINLTV